MGRGKPVVVVGLQGGLGNQLFEYAAGLHLARQKQADLLFRHPWEQGLNIFDVLPAGACAEVPAEVLARFRVPGPGASIPRRAIDLLMSQLPWHAKRYGVLREAPRKPGALPEMATSRNVLMLGWFINSVWYEPTFREVAGMLLQRLAAHPAFDLARQATVMSFRRGDFVRAGWALSTGYYERALERLGRVSGPVLVIGDDDMFCDFVVQWLGQRGCAASTRPSFPGSTGITDLALLAGAQNVIMANSTFCWWGTTCGDLARPEGRRVLVPHPWNLHRRPREDGSGDLSPQGWERVESSFVSGPD